MRTDAPREEGVCGFALCGPGGDRLSRVLRHSTMGAGVFNGRVRDGIGFWAHRSGHQAGATQLFGASLGRRVFATAGGWFGKHGSDSRGCAGLCSCDRACLARRWITRDDQACRAISTGPLSALLHVHARPIDVVVFHGPQGRPRFEGGFPLRCLQRLSRPYIAMLHCRWRDNSSTRGTFIPVLSY